MGLAVFALPGLALAVAPSLFLQALGVVLIAAALVDVFLTVLYARIGTAIVSNRVAILVWRVFLRLSAHVGRHRVGVLSLGGPIILVCLLAMWTLGLTFGAALLVVPQLGKAVVATQGPTPTGFAAALYAAGEAVSVVGASDLVPKTTPFRLLYLFHSMVGMSVVSLTLTYLTQVYGALQRRNTLGLKLDLLAAETGDAAELLAALGPGGDLEGGRSELANLAAQLTAVKESQHFYPVLFFFRFREPRYASSRIALLALDTVSLIRSALAGRHAWLQRAAAVEELWRAALLLVTTLEDTFVPRGSPRPKSVVPEDRIRWRRRYRAAVERLRQSGIETHADPDAGAELYVAMRERWDGHIATLAPVLGYRLDEIDPAGRAPDPEAGDGRLGAGPPRCLA